MSDDVVSLLVNGRLYLGWTSVQITKTMEAIAGSFSISATDRWSIDEEPWPIKPGDECVLKIGDDSVITGFVDSTNPSIESQRRSLSISGRDKAGDLVDCSDDVRPGEFKNLTALQIAQALAKSFEISVSADVDVGAPFSVFAIQPGETAFDAIARACQKRSLLPVSASDGSVKLLRTSVDRADDSLIEGQNILRATANHSMNNRFSDYTIKSQAANVSGWSGKDAAQMKAISKDTEVPRFRPRTVIESGDNKVSELQKRADWEAASRAGQSTTANISVQGWRQSTERLWTVNELIFLRSQAIQIEQDMLIKGVNFSLDINGGQKVALSLTRPDAFLAEPPDPKNEALQ